VAGEAYSILDIASVVLMEADVIEVSVPCMKKLRAA
jgi:hypothetical protein